MAEEMSRFVDEVCTSRTFATYFFGEESLKNSSFYESMWPEDIEMTMEMIHQGKPKWKPVQGRDIGDVRHYGNLNTLIGEFGKENHFIQKTADNSRLCGATFTGGDGLGDRVVTVKTWDFLHPIQRTNAFYVGKFCNELKMLTSEEMKSCKNLVNVIGFSLEPTPVVVYDAQWKEYLYDVIPSSEKLDWNSRMIAAMDIARLVELMHGKQIVVGSTSATSFMIDNDGDVKLFEFGIPVDEKIYFPPLHYLYASYGYFGPEIYSTEFHSLDSFFKVDIYFCILDQPWLEKMVVDELDAQGSFVHESFPVDDGKNVEVTKLALSCIQQVPADRPSMGEVAGRLENLFGYMRGHLAKKRSD